MSRADAFHFPFMHHIIASFCIHVIKYGLNNHNVSNIGYSGIRKESSRFRGIQSIIGITLRPKLRAIARNEHESLETMIRTLEQQLQQQKDRTDRFIADWQNREDEWRHTCQEIQTSRDQWEAENENRKVYIRFLAD